MEMTKKFSVASYQSFYDALVPPGATRKAMYGKRSRRLNAAVAMFLMSPPHMQEAWMTVVDSAKNLDDDQTILERVKQFVSPDESQSDPPRLNNLVHGLGTIHGTPNLPPSAPKPTVRRKARRGA